MRTILTLAPLIIASILAACGPGVSGGDRSSVGRYAGEILGTDGLVFYLRMDESGGSISDFFGRGIGTVEGVPIYKVLGGMHNNGGGEPQPNSAIRYDGATCFNFGEIDALKLQPPFSIVFMATANVIGPSVYIGDWANLAGRRGWALMADAGPSVQFTFTYDGTTQNNYTWAPLTTNWDHYALTVDSNGNATTYLNGNFYNNPGAPITSPIFSNTGNNIRSGCSDNFIEYLNGNLDELAIFNQSLSAQDIFRINQSRFN